MRYIKSFSIIRVFILLGIIGGLTVFSFLAAFAKDEGTLGNSLFLSFMADAFYVFRFPMHFLFGHYLEGGFFFYGLIINVIFYAFLLEGFLAIFKITYRLSPTTQIHPS